VSPNQKEIALQRFGDLVLQQSRFHKPYKRNLHRSYTVTHSGSSFLSTFEVTDALLHSDPLAFLMPLLLDAAVHRFAVNFLQDMAAQAINSGAADSGAAEPDAESWVMNDLAAYHAACFFLATDWDRNWSHDSVVIRRGPNWDGDGHAKAELLFGRLSREQRDERRWGLLHRFHGLALCILDGEPISEENARLMTTREGKGRKGGDKGKGKKGGKGGGMGGAADDGGNGGGKGGDKGGKKGIDGSADHGVADAFTIVWEKGYRKGFHEGFAKGRQIAAWMS